MFSRRTVLRVWHVVLLDLRLVDVLLTLHGDPLPQHGLRGFSASLRILPQALLCRY